MAGPARRPGRSAGTGAAEPALRRSLGPAGRAGGSGAPTLQMDLILGVAAPGCGRKVSDCGKRQGLKPHGNSPFAQAEKRA